MRPSVVLALVAEFIVFALLLYAGAGTWRWPEAWLFLILFFAAATLLSAWLERHDPALLAERMRWPVQQVQPLWDRVIMISVMPVFILWLVVMGVDSVRLRSVHFAFWLKAAGLIGLSLSFWGLYRVFRENSFLAPVVKLQQAQGHHVVSTGPYAFIRHPMYAFALLLLFSVPLLLGSLLGLYAALGLLALIVVRTALEDAMLRRSLPGYADYAGKVRYRLMPGLW